MTGEAKSKIVDAEAYWLTADQAEQQTGNLGGTVAGDQTQEFDAGSQVDHLAYQRTVTRNAVIAVPPAASKKLPSKPTLA
ncbi:MAG: hypothetical protein U1C04_17500 [Hydrogenophaga sp.]|uniref:hypothetical protein n=1 Tax=Hydrogenophaga sp. TaxID=1904254 RepID=UPI002AB8D663|nr:hypothetical protein [Hydrogenophaga sp.]MDZ4282547.1 hypothetical protein [Hydrogenophaga sp.]